MKHVRPKILISEAACNDGCGLMPSDSWLDTVNLWLELCGGQVKLTSMARCDKHNLDLYKGDATKACKSPHILTQKNLGFGAADGRCISPKRRTRLLLAAYDLWSLGFINHIEICDRHIHIALVPEDHPYAGLSHRGKSI